MFEFKIGDKVKVYNETLNEYKIGKIINYGIEDYEIKYTVKCENCILIASENIIFKVK